MKNKEDHMKSIVLSVFFFYFITQCHAIGGNRLFRCNEKVAAFDFCVPAKKKKDKVLFYYFVRTSDQCCFHGWPSIAYTDTELPLSE